MLSNTRFMSVTKHNINKCKYDCDLCSYHVSHQVGGVLSISRNPKNFSLFCCIKITLYAYSPLVSFVKRLFDFDQKS